MRKAQAAPAFQVRLGMSAIRPLSMSRTKKAATPNLSITSVSGFVYSSAEPTVMKELPQKKVARTSASTGMIGWWWVSNVDLCIFQKKGFISEVRGTRP